MVNNYVLGHTSNWSNVQHKFTTSNSSFTIFTVRVLWDAILQRDVVLNLLK